LLALGIFATNTGGYALGFWLPTTVKNLSGGSDRAALFYSGLFYACGLLGVFASGQSSDRSGDRKWHCVFGQVATALLLAGSVITDWTFPDLGVEERILKAQGIEVEGRQCKTESELIALCAEADTVITQFARVNANVIAAMRKARAIVRYGIGVDNIDLDAA